MRKLILIVFLMSLTPLLGQAQNKIRSIIEKDYQALVKRGYPTKYKFFGNGYVFKPVLRKNPSIVRTFEQFDDREPLLTWHIKLKTSREDILNEEKKDLIRSRKWEN